jgi:hypothetical protein
VDAIVLFEQRGCLERGQRLAAAGRVPDVSVAAVLFDTLHNQLDRVDLIGPHDHQLLLVGQALFPGLQPGLVCVAPLGQNDCGAVAGIPPGCVSRWGACEPVVAIRLPPANCLNPFGASIGGGVALTTGNRRAFVCSIPRGSQQLAGGRAQRHHRNPLPIRAYDPEVNNNDPLW